ncbi:hypothetical protein 3 [Wenzhou crab virus 4]|uniref:hypothetical protein 3 n=1 Tax=Wenzhou crab virus 4 TaxID=1923561 RepID=UPI000909FCA0|nr:hypothetical protein 3 [Wenzhou crab virus 4]APG76641.1 hypothetical protein 3 [Wenzhou crab virus 4]
MTGNNRSANAGRRKATAHSQKPKRAPRRVTRRMQAQAVQPGGVLAPLMESNANYREMKNGFTRVAGSDFLGTVSVTGSPADAASRIRKVLSISPSAYPGTRITQMADLWERFIFRKFRLRYVPSVPNTLACQVMIYQDTDPQDDPTVITDPDALVRQATAQTGSQQWNFNSAKAVHLAKRSDGQLYYTGPVKENPRFNQQGVAYLIQVSEALNFNGEKLSGDLECGSLYVDWEVDFQTPQINPSAVVSPPTPPPGKDICPVHTLFVDDLAGVKIVPDKVGIFGTAKVWVQRVNFMTQSSAATPFTVKLGTDKIVDFQGNGNVDIQETELPLEGALLVTTELDRPTSITLGSNATLRKVA